MKKGDIIEGTIENYSFPNKGSFLLDDRKIVVKGGLPGTTARIRITKKKSGYAEGIIQETLKASPLETKKPVCPHFYECGGCAYQNVAYNNQLRLKEQMVKELLSAVVEELPWEGIEPSPNPLQYRNKMEFSFGDAEKDGPLTLGLHRQGSSYDILEVKGCAIVRPACNEILKFTQKFFREHKVSFYHKMQHYGILRHLVIRQSFADGGILVNLVTTTRHELPPAGTVTDGLEKAGLRNEVIEELHLPEYVAGLLRLENSGCFETLSSHSHLAGVLYTENDSLADAVVCDSLTKLYGDDFLMEELLGLKFRISPFSFFQTNTRGCEVLYKKVREFVLSACPDGKAGVIYDLYCGTGTIAQILSPIADKVYGIEIVEEAVEAARENAKLNHLKNCEFLAGDVLKMLDEIEEKPDFIVLDPPRDGCTPKALDRILSYGVDNIVYVSCKPTSLARDLVTMQQRGYRVVRAAATDEYPQTLHVETVVLMNNKNAKPKDYVEIGIDAEEYYNIKDSEKVE